MLLAYTNGLELLRHLRPMIEELKGHDPNLADQIQRAASSVTLNVGEGSRRSGKDRKRFYRMAYGSAGEIEAALDTAAAWGWAKNIQPVRDLLDRELRLLWRLQRS